MKQLAVRSVRKAEASELVGRVQRVVRRRIGGVEGTASSRSINSFYLKNQLSVRVSVHACVREVNNNFFMIERR
jgi:hypothetical protein